MSEQSTLAARSDQFSVFTEELHRYAQAEDREAFMDHCQILRDELDTLEALAASEEGTEDGE